MIILCIFDLSQDITKLPVFQFLLLYEIPESLYLVAVAVSVALVEESLVLLQGVYEYHVF